MNHLQLVRIRDKRLRLDNEFYENAALQQNQVYLLQAPHAQGIVDLRLGELVNGVGSVPLLTTDALKPQAHLVRILFLFNGGLGDAIALACLLRALKKEYRLESDVACRSAVYEDILRPLGFSGQWIQPPVDLPTLKQYDYLQSSADRFITDKTDMAHRSIVAELGRAYDVDLNHDDMTYRIPDQLRETALPPNSHRVRIGVHFDSKGRVKSYPPSLQPDLLNRLLRAGFKITLLGSEQPDLPAAGPSVDVEDYRGRTSVPELAAIISHMDAVLCVDSFIAHLADVLGIKTLVLLSVTREGIFSKHKHITCIESDIDCAPCGSVHDECPRALSECQAFWHPSIRPASITRSVIRHCAEHFDTFIQKNTGLSVVFPHTA
jgi:ADP-heptose:LPS heptosyltransferase